MLIIPLRICGNRVAEADTLYNGVCLPDGVSAATKQDLGDEYCSCPGSCRYDLDSRPCDFGIPQLRDSSIVFDNQTISLGK